MRGLKQNDLIIIYRSIISISNKTFDKTPNNSGDEILGSQIKSMFIKILVICNNIDWGKKKYSAIYIWHDLDSIKEKNTKIIRKESTVKIVILFELEAKVMQTTFYSNILFSVILL